MRAWRFKEAQLWFSEDSESATGKDSEFYIVLSLEQTIEFLKGLLPPRDGDEEAV